MNRRRFLAPAGFVWRAICAGDRALVDMRYAVETRGASTPVLESFDARDLARAEARICRALVVFQEVRCRRLSPMILVDRSPAVV